MSTATAALSRRSPIDLMTSEGSVSRATLRSEPSGNVSVISSSDGRSIILWTRMVGGLLLAPRLTTVARSSGVSYPSATTSATGSDSSMSRFRYRDDDSYTSTVLGVLVGALAGFAAGMVVAQRVGGFAGIRDRLRRRGTTRDERLHEAHGVAEDVDEEEFEDIED